MGRYTKIPVTIEAWQWKGAAPPDTTPSWIMDGIAASQIWRDGSTMDLKIKTLEGTMTGSVNDWIIKGVKGEIYPCKPDIFEATYQPAAIVAEQGIADELDRLIFGQPGRLMPMDRSVYATSYLEGGHPIDHVISEVEEVDAKTHPRGQPIEVTVPIDIDDPIHPDNRDEAFRRELESLVNRHSREGGCDTPDFILAEFLLSSLHAFDHAVARRESWYGHRGDQPPPVSQADRIRRQGERIRYLEAQLRSEGEHTAAATAKIGELEEHMRDIAREANLADRSE